MRIRSLHTIIVCSTAAVGQFESKRGTTMSVEPGRTTAYSPDIGWRVVWQRLGMELAFRDISRKLQIAVGTAHRIYKRFEESGDVAASKKPLRYETRKLDDLNELLVMGLVIDNPGLYLHEIRQQIHEVTSVIVSGPTVCSLLRHNGYTRKKIMQVAKQRRFDFRGAFMANVLQYDQRFFVWVDETGCGKKDHIRKFGYAF